ITMGIGSIMKARRIVLLASGANKAEAVACLLAGKITTDCPATMLLAHADVTLICTEDALG
ncbi:MAG: 6-phosphogluconolactonase, partial [Oscillospiraceae bacterium]|nr:6-phosphogluconolactonase [Oscillospiraceae bacterium]